EEVAGIQHILQPRRVNGVMDLLDAGRRAGWAPVVLEDERHALHARVLRRIAKAGHDPLEALLCGEALHRRLLATLRGQLAEIGAGVTAATEHADDRGARLYGPLDVLDQLHQVVGPLLRRGAERIVRGGEGYRANTTHRGVLVELCELLWRRDAAFRQVFVEELDAVNTEIDTMIDHLVRRRKVGSIGTTAKTKE